MCAHTHKTLAKVILYSVPWTDNNGYAIVFKGAYLAAELIKPTL